MGALLLASCGGGGETTEGAEPAEQQSTEPSVSQAVVDEQAESTTPVEALRVRFDSVHDAPFELFDLDGDLWLVDADFSALRIDPTVKVSSCDSSLCLSAPNAEFGDVFVPVGQRLFTIETNFSPNQFLWLGSELADAPHLVQDEKVAPGNARGELSEHIVRVGDRVFAYDAQSSAIESIDATTPAIDSAPEIGAPIPVDPPFPDNTRLIASGDTVWLYSNQNSVSYPSGERGPIPAAAVDVESGTLGPVVDLVADEYGSVTQVAAAGHYLIVDGTNGDESGNIEPFVTAFAPDGSATPIDLPDGSLRNLTSSGDRALAVMEEDAHRTFVIDPATGSAEPIDLDVSPDATVTAWYGHDDGVWAIANGRDLATTFLRIDLAEGSVVERIELTDELDDAADLGFVDGRPYFVLGDGTSGEWELVVLGGDGIDLGYATAATAERPEDDATVDDEPADDGTSDGEPSDVAEPTSSAEPVEDEPIDDEPVAGTTDPPAFDDDCPPGESLQECYG